MRLNADGSRHRIKPLLLVESGANPIEDIVIAVDVAQIATGLHDVLPRRAFALQQAGNVGEGSLQLSGKIADVNGDTVLVNRGSAGNDQNGNAVQVKPDAARERTRLGVVEGFVQNAVVGDGAPFNRCVRGRLRNGLQNFRKCIHDDGSFYSYCFSRIPWL